MLQMLPALQTAGIDTRYIVQTLLGHFPEFDVGLALPQRERQGPMGMDQFAGQLAGQTNANVSVPMPGMPPGMGEPAPMEIPPA